MADLAKHRKLPFSTLALAVASFIAVTAIGVAIWKKSSVDQAPAITPQSATQPDVNSVIAKLEAQLKDKPNDAEGWRMLGWSLFQTNKFAEAAQAYARATQIDPSKADYWASLGEARVLAGQGTVSEDAKLAFNKALALDPKDPRSRYFLGVAKDMAGDHRGAIDDWFALLKDTPTGAPWESDVRRLISEVGARAKIDVTARLAGVRPAPSPSAATNSIPGPTQAQLNAGANLPSGQKQIMIDAMVDGLEAKLKANPNNASGWMMLMRSRMELGEGAKAKAAFAAAKAAFAGNQDILRQLDTAASELGVAR